MNVHLSRRTLAVLTVGLVTGSSGCLSFGNSGPVPGSLTIRNETETVQTVSVRASKVSDDSDDEQQYNETPDPDVDATVINDNVFELQSDDRHRIEGWLSDPGLYFLEANAGRDRTDTIWVGLYPAGPNGTSVAEDTVHLSVEKERLWFGTSVAD